MRFSPYLLFVPFLLASCKAKSSPAAPTSGVPFVSERFHFTFTLPAELKQQPVRELNLSKDNPAPGEVLVFAARVPDRPLGIMVIAEPMNAPDERDPFGFQTGNAYLQHLAPGKRQDPGFQELKHSHFTTASGLTMDELDYKVNDQYAAGLAFPVETADGPRLIVFKCEADSLALLNRMTQSISSAKPV